MALCPECHHRPSQRRTYCSGYTADCYCKCHDVADAAPDLLAACKQAVAFGSQGDTHEGLSVSEILRAAIAKAEPKGT